ncbi:hypothetical protein BGZ96_006921 [Linnemannia gamsii]|uniref:Uncharacterized protein n=1 Tax=Linnemannia gamsii TaxID=64522 RepID=A0ABQ7K1I9_9FUNG|nr:hypothetical protein BGZ96_006921 [Linnemannia gamsii]
MAPSAIAACAVRGNSIYLYYHSTQNLPFYPLSVLSTQHPSSPSNPNPGPPTATPGPINPYTPSSLSQTNNYGQYDTTTTAASKSNDNEKVLAADPGIAPATPSNDVNGGVNGLLYHQPLFLTNSGPNLGSLGNQASSLSMVSMNTNRHDLLLAFNGVKGPVLVRMTPQDPSTGNGLDSLSGYPWTSRTIQPPVWSGGEAATQLWIAAPRGSITRPIVNDIFANGDKLGSLQLGTFDVDYGQQMVILGGGSIPISNSGNPVLVHLDSISTSPSYDMAVIGVSSSEPNLTGVYFSRDDRSFFLNKTIPDM